MTPEGPANIGSSTTIAGETLDEDRWTEMTSKSRGLGNPHNVSPQRV
jgi:hypothetical protein